MEKETGVKGSEKVSSFAKFHTKGERENANLAAMTNRNTSNNELIQQKKI